MSMYRVLLAILMLLPAVPAAGACPNVTQTDFYPGLTPTWVLIHPGGGEFVPLTGSLTIESCFEPNLGDAFDDDGDGLEDIDSEIIQLQLTGTNSLGSIDIAISTLPSSLGVIQEKVNNFPGVLDVPPFAASGSATSRYDLHLTVTIAGTTILHSNSEIDAFWTMNSLPESSLQMTALLERATSLYFVPVQLFDEGENPTSYYLGSRMIPAVPDPPQEVEYGVEPVEYSNNFDEQGAVDAASNPTGGHGPADPGQTLYTEPPDGPTASDQNPSDGTDFVPGLESGTEPDSQIDALAYGDDAGLDALLADETELLVSVVADGNAEEVAVFIEDATGALQIHYTHESLNHVDPAGELDDLDALELWGPVGQADADYYSLQGDAVTGTSVYLYFGGTVLTFVEWADIVTAVQSLGYEGDPNAVDVDALMVGDQNDRETFADGDLIVFSIRGVPGSGFDGGEIIVLQSGQPPYFLMHSGNTWNPAFDVTSAVTNALGGVDPGAGGEDVDAIEAIAEPTAAVPVLGVLGLMALAASLLATGGLLRKK